MQYNKSHFLQFFPFFTLNEYFFLSHIFFLYNKNLDDHSLKYKPINFFFIITPVSVLKVYIANNFIYFFVPHFTNKNRMSAQYPLKNIFLITQLNFVEVGFIFTFSVDSFKAFFVEEVIET